jgi:hypothetical protein
VTFEKYWRTVLGLGSADEVVRTHDLIPDGLDEWLGAAEEHAWTHGGARVGCGGIPEEWREFHARALGMLEAAAVEVCTQAAEEEEAS